jgi:RNA polymerase sigma-70 factor, ECF subfamily
MSRPVPHPDRSFHATVTASSPIPTDRDPDSLLVEAMARGDEHAATALYDRVGAMVYGLALRMLGDAADAEEIVVEVFAQAWRDAARYTETRGSVIAWLTTITRTRALDHVRARRRRAAAMDRAEQQSDTVVAMGESPGTADVLVVDQERAAAVNHALTVLPDAQRRCIELAFFEGLTHHEVAMRIGEPLGTVKTRIRLGLLKLRERLTGFSREAT